MFFEEQIRDAIRRSETQPFWIAALCLPAILLMFIVLMARDWIDSYSGINGQSSLPDFLAGGLMAFMVVVLIAAAAYSICQQKKLPLKCPGCERDLWPRPHPILVTRSCPACNKQIVFGGKVRRLEVARRYERWKNDRIMMFLMTAAGVILPIIGIIIISKEWFTWSEQGRPFVVGPVVGVAAFTIAFFGYYNWRRWWFLLEMFVAIAIGVLGGWLYWYF